MAKYFPAPGAVDEYCSSPEEYSRIAADTDALVPPELIEKLDKTGRAPVPGDVKYVFLTKSGPGPIRQPLEESLLDPETGMPVPPGPKHKRMRI